MYRTKVKVMDTLKAIALNEKWRRVRYRYVLKYNVVFMLRFILSHILTLQHSLQFMQALHKHASLTLLAQQMYIQTPLHACSPSDEVCRIMV